MSWSKQHWLILSLFLLATTFISLQFVFSLPIDGGLNGVYGCYVYRGTYFDSPGTPCLGTQNCARYFYEALPAPEYTLADSDDDTDGYYTICGQDCDDTLGGGSVNPGATEVCGNDIDENCDGIADACPLKVETFSSSVSGTDVTLTATTNYVARCCFSEDASDYDTCAGGSNLGIVTTDSSGVASVSTSQTAGTSTTYHVYCRSPP